MVVSLSPDEISEADLTETGRTETERTETERAETERSDTGSNDGAGPASDEAVSWVVGSDSDAAATKIVGAPSAGAATGMPDPLRHDPRSDPQGHDAQRRHRENGDPMRHDDVNRLRLVLLRLTRSLRARYVGDITPSQLAVLTSLMIHGPSSIGQIAEREHVKAPSASKVVSALEERGLVTRAVDPNDRRSVRITTTDAAEEYAARIRAVGTSWLADRMDSLAPDDVVRIEAALPALERLLGAPE